MLQYMRAYDAVDFILKCCKGFIGSLDYFMAGFFNNFGGLWIEFNPQCLPSQLLGRIEIRAVTTTNVNEPAFGQVVQFLQNKRWRNHAISKHVQQREQ